MSRYVVFNSRTNKPATNLDGTPAVFRNKALAELAAKASPIYVVRFVYI